MLRVSDINASCHDQLGSVFFRKRDRDLPSLSSKSSAYRPSTWGAEHEMCRLFVIQMLLHSVVVICILKVF